MFFTSFGHWVLGWVGGDFTRDWYTTCFFSFADQHSPKTKKSQTDIVFQSEPKGVFLHSAQRQI